ncbi:hypothetical protein FRC19_010971 [Serendipita sp. 401]|nr:hypothetical protein FRC19_010971 [Serendipita sp. 401]
MRYIPRRVSKAVKKLFGRYEESDIEDGLPFPNGDTRLSITPSPTGIRQIKLSEGGEKEYTVTDSPILSRVERVSDDDNHIPSIRSPTRLLSLASGMSSPPGTPLADEQAKSPTPMKLTGVNRFRQIAWKVAENQKEVSSIGSTGMMRSVTLLPDPTKRRDTAEGKTAELQQPKPGRLTAIRPALKKLRVTHTILDHTGLVRHLQFSPNGKILATCGWDGTARLFMVPQDRSDVERGKVMAVADGFLGQVAWSPDGNWLLTKWTTGVQLWSSEAGVRKKNIPRRRPVRSVAWFPSNKSFLSVEGSQVIQFSLDGEIEAVHELERLELYDVAITPDEERLLGVAILTRTKSGYTPRMSKIEKRVVVYNLKDRKIESLVPVLDEVRDITISRDGQLVLVSSENKDPPQLLRVDIVAGIGRLVPIRTYLPKQDVDFAGPSYFAGLQDELILVPTKSGDILFWDRESGQLLHALRNRDVGDGDLTSVAWNYASRKHMLASASHDGAIRIWMTGPSEKDLNRASSFGFGTEFEMATSPHHMSRAGTSATDNMQAFSDSFATFQGRPSRRGSVNAGSFDGHRERRRVDSPVPSEPSGDKVGGPNSVGGK